ncbi:hypothetical protein [Streptomyces sp. NPDC058620]|uniref:hypothetical protein n=1 Tax=Streptomyces sp. NPDC058620 TaxID=3346560 RepID=UPI003658EBED
MRRPRGLNDGLLRYGLKDLLGLDRLHVLGCGTGAGGVTCALAAGCDGTWLCVGCCGTWPGTGCCGFCAGCGVVSVTSLTRSRLLSRPPVPAQGVAADTT